MRRPLIPLLFAALLASAWPAIPAAAAEDRSPGALLDRMLTEALGAIDLIVKAIPQYEAPEVLENGDILIRRKRPAPEPPETKPTIKTDSTKT